jgi:hypothetical protein
MGPDVVASVTCPPYEDIAEGAVAVLFLPHANAEIRSRRTQPRLNVGIGAPEWITFLPSDRCVHHERLTGGAPGQLDVHHDLCSCGYGRRAGIRHTPARPNGRLKLKARRCAHLRRNGPYCEGAIAWSDDTQRATHELDRPRMVICTLVVANRIVGRDGERRRFSSRYPLYWIEVKILNHVVAGRKRIAIIPFGSDAARGANRGQMPDLLATKGDAVVRGVANVIGHASRR